MASGYIPLPAYRVPENAMLSFSGLNEGIDAIGRRRELDQTRAERAEERQYQRGRNAMVDQRYADERAYSRGRDTLADTRYADETTYNRGRQNAMDDRDRRRFEQDEKDRRAKRFQAQVGLIAPLVEKYALTEKDPAKRTEIMRNIFSQHADLADAPAQFLDGVNGPELFMATAQDHLLDRRKQQAEVEKLESENAFNRSLGGMIDGSGATPAAPTQPPAMYQPQSYAPDNAGQPRLQPISDTYPAQSTPPGIVLAQNSEGPDPTAPPVADGPSPGAAYNLPGDENVNTAFGRMPRDQARRLGMGLALRGKGDAGRMMIDAASTGSMTKPTINAVQEKQLNAVEQYARLKAIKQSWKPEYQTIDKRLGFAWNSLVDKFGGTRKSLTSQQRQELAAYSASRAEGLNNLNQYIKEITGAAMTIPEANRIKKTQPNPGEGIFDGDSPTEFQSKMDTNIRLTEMALARYSYLTKNGFDGTVDEMSKQIPLDDMPRVIQQETNKIQNDVMKANPGVPRQELVPIIQQRLRAQFGIES
jgi:hypothetical protein